MNGQEAEWTEEGQLVGFVVGGVRLEVGLGGDDGGE